MLQSCLAEVLNFKKVERKVVKGLLHGTRKWEKKKPFYFSYIIFYAQWTTYTAHKIHILFAKHCETQFVGFMAFSRHSEPLTVHVSV